MKLLLTGLLMFATHISVGNTQVLRYRQRSSLAVVVEEADEAAAVVIVLA